MKITFREILERMDRCYFFAEVGELQCHINPKTEEEYYKYNMAEYENRENITLSFNNYLEKPINLDIVLKDRFSCVRPDLVEVVFVFGIPDPDKLVELIRIIKESEERENKESEERENLRKYYSNSKQSIIRKIINFFRLNT